MWAPIGQVNSYSYYQSGSFKIAACHFVNELNYFEENDVPNGRSAHQKKFVGVFRSETDYSGVFV